MKKFNFSLRAEFDAKCTIQANNRQEACEILKNYLHVQRAELLPDVCADEAKNIIDYEIDTVGTIRVIHVD